MEMNQILLKLQDIFREILDNKEIVLSNETHSDDVEEWDSLAHIQLIVAIEKEFKVKFTAKEMIGWQNVGEMVECIKNKNR